MANNPSPVAPAHLEDQTTTRATLSREAGLYLAPFAYALIIDRWGSKIPAWVVILSALLVLSLFAIAAVHKVKQSGGVQQLETYIRTHLWASISFIVLVCCVILGTTIYVVMRPPVESKPPERPAVASGAPFHSQSAPQDQRGSTPPSGGQKTPSKRPPRKPHTPPVTHPETTVEPTTTPPEHQNSEPTHLPSTAPTLAGQPPSNTQNCTGSNCFQGTNNGTVTQNFNQYGAPALVMTQKQFGAITEAMRPFAGKHVEVEGDQATQDSIDYGKNLVHALQNAGMVPTDDIGTVLTDNAFLLSGVIMTGYPAVGGVQILAGQNREPEATALASVLGTTNLIHNAKAGPDTLTVVVRPNR